MEVIVKRFEELDINELYEILKLRVDVFVVEQNCPYPELDDKDKSAWHVYIREDGKITAYLRVLDPGVSFDTAAIGRVISTRRRCGLGTTLLREGIRVARERMNTPAIKIEAQTYARAFYELQGFQQTSDEFLEDGIPHIEMTLEL
ncbi:MAG: GNAT family N-acetyltransferase [Oscillospiraceae bacterium]|nr:GNAT family N-acetyltransferase [Oscillospiraceae bacterium]